MTTMNKHILQQWTNAANENRQLQQQAWEELYEQQLHQLLLAPLPTTDVKPDYSDKTHVDMTAKGNALARQMYGKCSGSD
jgi:hypothetical protein